MMPLQVLYQDEHLVAINKPHDLLVHRSKIANDVKEFALQLLRDQLNRHVYPIHRLDRKTGGVLLFGLNEESHRKMQQLFAERRVKKRYLAIVRGFVEDEQTIDYPLFNENGQVQDAITRIRPIQLVELNIPFGKHVTSRYTLLEAFPETGRQHQIRKHLAHIRHPIIADRPWGDNKQNKLFKERFGLMTMMLHAAQLDFPHPYSGAPITIKADLQPEFKRILGVLGVDFATNLDG
jgi:tRNA pseudouridine65 synthase